MSIEEIKKELSNLGDLIDTLNNHKDKSKLPDELNQSFEKVIEHYISIYDSLEEELTELKNQEEPSWMELYREEKFIKVA